MYAYIQIGCFLHQLRISHLLVSFYKMIQKLQKGTERENLPCQPWSFFYLLISLYPAFFHQQFQVAYNESSFSIRPKTMTAWKKKKTGRGRSEWWGYQELLARQRSCEVELANFTACLEGKLVHQSKDNLYADSFIYSRDIYWAPAICLSLIRHWKENSEQIRHKSLPS